MRPKLTEVAAIAGVSEATVSRVINGKRGVAETTRHRVLQALGDLGYREVTVPAGSGTIGVVTPELDNPVFPILAQAIQRRLTQRGFLTLVCTATVDTIHEEDYLALLSDIDAAGAIVVSGRNADLAANHTIYSPLIDAGIVTVLVNGAPSDNGIPTIAVDEHEAARIAVRHLATLGHRRIGLLVGPRRYVTADGKIQGYESTMTELFGADVETHVAESVFTVEGGHAGGAQLLESGCTAVVAGSDLMALGVVRAARSWGLDVPGDVSVVGYDGTPLVDFTDPPLTTVRQPFERMAAAVADAMGTKAGPGLPPPRLQLFRPDLVVGGTTAPPQRN